MPFAAPYPALVGSWLTEWGGGRRWLISNETPANVIAETSRSGGLARCISAPDESPPGDEDLMALVARIKSAFDPDDIFAPGCHWGGP
jgi:hypothetical protein